MSDRYQGKYRIASTRLRNWDYGWNGLYFITICTSGRHPYFGVIENKNMALSDIGLLVRFEWEKSFVLRPGLYCDNYVIMPNHIHAILRIDNDDSNQFDNCAILRIENDDSDQFDNCAAETHRCASLQGASLQGDKSKFGVARRSPKSISSFVACFKSMVTMNARKINSGFGWQTRFHDHIIRNDREYQRIANYILNNPANWGLDK